MLTEAECDFVLKVARQQARRMRLSQMAVSERETAAALTRAGYFIFFDGGWIALTDRGYDTAVSTAGHRARVALGDSPFKPGDIVRIKDGEPDQFMRVEQCQIIQAASGTIYWRCHCSDVREGPDWTKIPRGATGVIAYSGWSGSASDLVLADQK